MTANFLPRRLLPALPILAAIAPADRPQRAGARPASAAGARLAGPMHPREAERFRASMLPHLDAAYGFARFLCRDAAQAEDIVQDAFLTAHRSFAGWRGTNPKAWLFAIVRSSFLTSLRRRRAEPMVEGEDALEEVADEAATPEAVLLRQAADAAVRAAIEALAEPFREAIVLRELQDMSYKEIADITGVPVGTVMSRLARARKLLASALAEARS